MARPSTSQGGAGGSGDAPPYTASTDASYEYDDEPQRPGTAAGGGSRSHNPWSYDDQTRPTTSRAGRGGGAPLGGDQAGFAGGDAVIEEDEEEEEEYEESEDEDVFAYLPPNTAQGQQLQQLQNAQAARVQQRQQAPPPPPPPDSAGAFAYSYPGEAPGSAAAASFSTSPSTPSSAVPLQAIAGRYANHRPQPSTTMHSILSTPPITASTAPPFAYDSSAYHNPPGDTSGTGASGNNGYAESYGMTPLSTGYTASSAPFSVTSSMGPPQQPPSRSIVTASSTGTGSASAPSRASREIHMVSLPGRTSRDMRKSSDYGESRQDEGTGVVGASGAAYAGHGRTRSFGEGDVGSDVEGLRYRADSKRTKTGGSSQDSVDDIRHGAGSMRSVKTDVSLTNVPYTPTLPSSPGGHLQYNSAHAYLDEDAEDSPYPEVRASVSNVDDPEMPAMTFRMWLLGMILCMIGAALNMFFNFRYPAPYVTPLILLLVAHPCGKFLAYVLPLHVWSVPSYVPLIGGGSYSLNPGPFNIKEHVLIYIMANVSLNPAYAMSAIVVSEKYYGYELGLGFQLLLILATQLTGFGLAGACRRFLVWPASLIWPANLVTCTLLNTLHAEDEEVEEGGGITRYRFFMIATTCTFFYYFLPGFLFEALSVFSFVCWIRPDNVVVNQLFGVISGLGMGIFTFDWSQISYIGSPLMVPWWAEVHIFAGFVLFYWIICPALYYSNVWNMSYLPISGNGPYDRYALPYNVSAVITSDMRLNVTAYEAYSPLYLPATYAITYLLAFMLSTAILVHTGLYHGRALLNGLKRIKQEDDDIHAKLMRNYPEVPDWWYYLIFVFFFVLAVIAIQIGHTDMPVWALFLAVAIPVIYVIPSSYIYAMTGQPVGVNLIAEVIPGAILQGRPIANMIFKCYSVQTMQVALAFTQDLKLGHYIKVPPRSTFVVQSVATVIAALVQVGTKAWLFANVPDICDPQQAHDLTCPSNEVFFTASAVWGLIGPVRQFGNGTVYHPELYALAIGVFLPIPFWWWQRKWPKSVVKYVNIPVLLNGPTFIPPATGINYASWFGVGLIFQYLVRTRNFRWWSKFNYILSASLDSGTVVSLMVVFLTLGLPKGGTISLNWWGNTVFMKTADANYPSYLTAPPEGFGA